MNKLERPRALVVECRFILARLRLLIEAGGES